MVPTVGRTVFYQAHGSPNGQFKSVPRAAIITAVSGEAAENAPVSLCVINPTGLFFHEACAYDPDGGPGTWRWPPRG